jgi:mannose-1-phosphate guanylyltransferase / phosphomannomutase
MRVAIIAGGKGTRLGEFSKTIPKALIPIGGKPILEHQLHLAKRHGATDVALLIGHLGDQIRDFCGDGSGFGLRITYFEEPQPLGTAGSLKLAEGFFSDDFLVFYGDVMMELNLGRLLAFHKCKGADATLVLHPNNHPMDSDLVEVDGNDRVVRVLPKPHADGLVYPNLVNAALYAFSPSVFSCLESGVSRDFGKHVFPRWVAEGMKLFGYSTLEYMKDIGTLDRLDQVNQDLSSGKIARSNHQLL